MKHKILNLFLFLMIGICAMACSSDDDNSSNAGEQSDQVSLSIVLPKTLNTSSQETTSNQLRCILEVWSKEVAPRLVYRTEVVKPNNQTEKFPLNFTLQSGTYNYLIWTDYIDSNAATEQKIVFDVSFTHYADKYYDTSNLKQVIVKDSKHFINNDACDAFFYNGEFQKKENEVCSLKAELIRPFTKISVRENDIEALKRIEELSFSYDFPVKFDVNSGKVSEDKSSTTYSNENFQPETAVEGTLFCIYVFTNLEGGKLGAINLTLKTTNEIEQDVAIPETLVDLERGKHIKVNGNIVQEGPDPDFEFEIIYKINVDDWNVEDVNV